MSILLPTRKVSVLYHWGTLNPDNVGKGGASQEGDCLSASLCPETWRTLARLGAGHLYSLSSEKGRFVDIYAILNDEIYSSIKANLLTRASQLGFIEEKEVFAVDYFFEDEHAGQITHFSYDAAISEADGEEDHVHVKRQAICTDKLLDHLGLSERFKSYGEEYGIIGVCKLLVQKGAKFDGIYFSDPYTPEAEIAPRFGLFPSRVGGWKFEFLQEIPDDRELMKTLAEIEVAPVGFDKKLESNGPTF